MKEPMQMSVESTAGSGKVVISKSVTDPKLCTLSGAGSGEKMAFSTTFMSRFLQASGIGDRVRMRMQAENPIRVEFPFLKNSHLHFILAPGPPPCPTVLAIAPWGGAGENTALYNLTVVVSDLNSVP